MARFSQLQNSFLGGELGPRLRARTDVDEYKQGAEFIKNFLPRGSGGLAFRPGFGYVATRTGPAIGLSQPYTIIPFKSSDSNGDRIIVITAKHATDTMRITAYTDIGGGAVPVEAGVATDATGKADLNLAPDDWSDDFMGFRYEQQGDVLYLTHTSGRMPPQIIVNNGGVLLMRRYVDGSVVVPGSTGKTWTKTPFAPRNLGAITVTPSVTTGSGTLTASAALFTASTVGAMFRVVHGASEGVAIVTAYTSSTVVSITVIQDFSATTASANWQVSQWGGGAGWPRYVATFEQRVVFASSLGYPSTVWNSEIGNGFLLAQDSLVQDRTTSDVSGNNYWGASKDDNDPFSYEPAGVSFIRWITGGRTLHIGSPLDELYADGSGGKYGFRNITIKSQTNMGSGPCNVVRVENSTFHISDDGKRLREFVYSDENGSYVNRDLTVLSEDILERVMDQTEASVWTGLVNSDDPYELKFRQLVWAPALQCLFAVVAGGVGSHSRVVGFAYDKSVGLKAWFHVMSVHNVVSIAYANKTLYILNQRTIAGSPKVFLERLGPIPMAPYDRLFGRIGTVQANRGVWNLDCASRHHVLATDPAISVFTNFTHLASQEVSVIADGTYIGERTVNASGELDFGATTYHDVQAGFKYDGRIKTLNLEAGATIGNAQPLYKKITDILMHLFKSTGGKYGFRDENLMDIEYPDFDGELYTGDSKRINFDSSSGETQHIIIVKDDPSPFYLLGISMTGVTEDQ